ncbi:hypothetical protein [Botrimarina mediterranea]|uniref:HEAT repeat protein n=1 Tax=Botrimarina mediterranea TaxID=2528022 RepID=A0A518K891_9BACT|nr:hypothetical protein [Botrimarina mediterranea]QDV74016.1 hypothetical protein Spa11_22150 [Botrimarina mediterranea]QDV78646.1 hypothetical protein K2D_22530 [Planctomycetes bacterium K2D]
MLTLAVVASAQGEVLPSAAAGAEPRGFWGNVAWTCRRAHLHCQTSNFGKFLGNAVRPISKLTGGLIPAPCDNEFAAAVELNATQPAGMAPGAVPKPPPPPPPSVAAAAQIKSEKAEAGLRREAVAYLACLDCRYYPEAEAALIASLRADRDECVRLEAAKALACGCCCTPATTKALTVCVTGGCDDGNPAERCPAVRQMALVALQRCQQCTDVSAPATPPEAPLSTVGSEDDAVRVAYAQPTAGGAPPPLDMPPVATPPAPKPPQANRSLVELWQSSKR